MRQTQFLVVFLLLSLSVLWDTSKAQESISTNNQGIVAARQDNNYDIVLYLNGQPLRVGGQLNLQAFQQLSGIVLSNGLRIPPTVRLSNGQLETVNAPFGVVNLAITVQRSFYGK